MKRRIPYLLISCMATLLLLIAASTAPDSTKVDMADKVKHEFIGAKKCKICHKEEYSSWETTSHAKAWDLLKPEEQKKEKCVGCHSTGITTKGVLLESVQCEACHGAGSDYKKKSIMEDRELSVKNGLIIPDSTVCVSCHNERSPTFEGFDYVKYRGNDKGIHKTGDEKKKTEKGKAVEEKD